MGSGGRDMRKCRRERCPFAKQRGLDRRSQERADRPLSQVPPQPGSRRATASCYISEADSSTQCQPPDTQSSLGGPWSTTFRQSWTTCIWNTRQHTGNLLPLQESHFPRVCFCIGEAGDSTAPPSPLTATCTWAVASESLTGGFSPEGVLGASVAAASVSAGG